MGYQRISAGVSSYVAAERLARGTHRSQEALSGLFFWVYPCLGALCVELVRRLTDWVPATARRERRTDGADDATNVGARRRQASCARCWLRGGAHSVGANPRPGHCWSHSPARDLALALPH